MPRDYKDTCLLPQTAFPMKADLFRREPEWLDRWRARDADGRNLYDRMLGRDVPGRFVFHDGPPYANGHMHYGHILNNALKDFVTRSRNMLGERTHFVPGWDCHGLPIELNVDRELKHKGVDAPPARVRQLCREEATRWMNVQREERQRLGVLGTWDEPYLTMNHRFEADIVRTLSAFVEHGVVYRGRKPVQWCAHCRTALAEAEVEYDEAHVSPSVYVKFELDAGSADKVRALTGATAGRLFAVIWTTTPWTLAANLAIAAHPELDYVVLEAPDGEGWLVAKPLAETVAKAGGVASVTLSNAVKGAGLAGVAARHPFEDRASPLLFADYVEADAGTGLVHTAPGHGRDDYATGQKNGLEPYAPVGDDGTYTNELGAGAKSMALEGVFVFKANPTIEEGLAGRGALVGRVGRTVTHKYPICWRCKRPLITRATTQWFIALDRPMKGGATLREKALGEIERLAGEGEAAATRGLAGGWVPAWGKERIKGMIQNRPDWCISRQRIWGVPIPAVHCKECHEAVLTPELLAHVAGVFDKRGADAWYDADPSVLPETITCPTCGPRPRDGWTRDDSIIDVWFESGSSFYAVCYDKPGLGTPVDLYLEGSDQHRGWFHSSLLVGCAVLGEAPYRTVVTHGFVCDDKGRAYSKSEIRRRQEGLRDRIVAALNNATVPADDDRLKRDPELVNAAPKLADEARKRLKKAKDARPEAVAQQIAEETIEYISPEKIIADQGAELFRAWVAFVDYENDMPYSRKILDQAVEAYRRVRNTLRFMLGALREEPAPALDEVRLEAIDRWAVARLTEVLAECEGAYRRFEFRAVFSKVLDFTQELSAFYLDASKDWLYNDPRASSRRQSAIATMQYLVRAVAVMIAPILPFSAEDVWDHLPRYEGRVESVHMETWPRPRHVNDAAELAAAMRRLRAVRDQVFAALEPVIQAWGVEKQAARKAGREPGAGERAFPEAERIDHARDADVTVTLTEPEAAELGAFRDHAGELLGVGVLRLVTGEKAAVSAKRAAGAPCDRCWRRRPDVQSSGLCTRCDEAVRIHRETTNAQQE